MGENREPVLPDAPAPGRWLSETAHDFRFAFRTLRREGGFTAFAVLIVGLGIGASATIFSVVNALLLRPLPFDDPSRLVWIANGGPDGNLSGTTTQVFYLQESRTRNKSFSDMAGYFAFYGTGDAKLTGDGEPERVSSVPVTQNFFPLLGVKPLIGRHFNDEECRWNGPKAVLMSYSLWQRRFNADPDVTSRKLIIDDKPVTIAGVLPESFDFANVFAPGARFDLFEPFPLSPETNRWGNTLSIVGRLKPGATVESAQAEFAILAGTLSRMHPEWNNFVPRLTMLEQHVSGRLRPALLVLAAAVGAVMLIVCANLSNLQLARMSARQKEMAIRAALGARRGRLIRQVLTESVALSCCGALLGIGLAVAGTRLLTSLEGISIPMLRTAGVDQTALGFALVIAVATGILFGIMPALQVPAVAMHGALKEGARGTSDGRRHAWIRGSLVVSEIAFACVLLVGAGLLIRSFLRVLDVDLGFHPEHAAAVRIDPSSQYRTQEQFNRYFDEALRLVRDVPGIEAAGLTDVLPLGRNRTWGAGAKGQIYPPGQFPTAFVRIVTDGYFGTMGIPIRSGRDFTHQDRPDTKKVIIVNEALAARLWPGENPIGKVMAQQDREVVGVVGNVRHIALEKDSGNEMYIPMRQSNDHPTIDLVVRTKLHPVQLAGAIRSAIRPIEPNLPANEFRTLTQLVDKAVSPRRFVVMLLAGFAGFALILASLGIYAVISYSVQQRRQEIGIRMALGATAWHLQWRILCQTLGLAAIGMSIGAAAALAVARAMSGLLYGVTAGDPVSFALMLIVLATVAALAGYVPALRASRTDPMVTLRAD
jgi:predicted permease